MARLKKLIPQAAPTKPFDFLRPMFDRLVVRRDSVESETSAGLFIPKEVRDKEPPNTGLVLSVGEGRLCPNTQGYINNLPADGYECVRLHVEPLRVKVGDHILFNSYAGTDIEDPITKEPLLLMQEDDVIAIINPEYLKNGQAEEPAAPTDPTPSPAEDGKPEVAASN